MWWLNHAGEHTKQNSYIDQLIDINVIARKIEQWWLGSAIDNQLNFFKKKIWMNTYGKKLIPTEYYSHKIIEPTVAQTAICAARVDSSFVAWKEATGSEAHFNVSSTCNSSTWMHCQLDSLPCHPLRRVHLQLNFTAAVRFTCFTARLYWTELQLLKPANNNWFLYFQLDNCIWRTPQWEAVINGQCWLGGKAKWYSHCTLYM